MLEQLGLYTTCVILSIFTPGFDDWTGEWSLNTSILDLSMWLRFWWEWMKVVYDFKRLKGLGVFELAFFFLPLSDISSDHIVIHAKVVWGRGGWHDASDRWEPHLRYLRLITVLFGGGIVLTGYINRILLGGKSLLLIKFTLREKISFLVIVLFVRF